MVDDTKNSKSLITSEFVEILKKEGSKVQNSCTLLEADKTFANTLRKITDEDFKQINYKVEHVLMYDLLKIYNELSTTLGEALKVPLKAKFIIIYYYEKFLGKDLSASLDIEKMNRLTTSDLFVTNIKTLRETSFFQPLATFKSEFITTSVVKITKSNEFQNIASFLNRIALLMVNSENEVSKEEAQFLKNISEKINNPKTAVNTIGYNEIPENDTLDIVMAELHDLIGMEAIKNNVKDLTNFLKVQKMREEKGLKTIVNSLHAVFMGPPGTGKTTVARLLGRIYKHLGYLEKGHLIETDRAGLVAGYVGQTAIKTDEIINSAIDGVLFIDEAYALETGGFNDFGGEAIEILLKRMEDNRGKLVVVVAGYPDEMELFIQSNPGLQSRFNRYFEFDHFSKESLLEILKLNVKKGDFKFTEDAEDKVNEIVERLHDKRTRNFGNARTMRNLFEKIIERQANRIVNLKTVTEEILMTITEEDIPDILKTVKEFMVFDEEE